MLTQFLKEQCEHLGSQTMDLSNLFMSIPVHFSFGPTSWRFLYLRDVKISNRNHKPTSGSNNLWTHQKRSVCHVYS